VHVYNNLYRVNDATQYRYSWGVGTESGIYAENNSVVSAVPLEPSRIAYAMKGTALYATGTLLNNAEVDVVAALNAKRDSDLMRDVGWKPALHAKIDVARDVEALVGVGAGPVATRVR
jgi:pectate lyase